MSELRVQRGLCFEEFVVGDGVTSAARTISETDIVNFAALSGDWNAMHVDREYASHTAVGERVAHGLLGLSIASGLAVQLGFIEETIIAFTGLEWRFVAPIRIGDTIRMRAQVSSRRPMPRLGGGVITFRVDVVNQRDEITQRGTWSMLVKSRPAVNALAEGN